MPILAEIVASATRKATTYAVSAASVSDTSLATALAISSACSLTMPRNNQKPPKAITARKISKTVKDTATGSKLGSVPIRFHLSRTTNKTTTFNMIAAVDNVSAKSMRDLSLLDRMKLISKKSTLLCVKEPKYTIRISYSHIRSTSPPPPRSPAASPRPSCPRPCRRPPSAGCPRTGPGGAQGSPSTIG
ncbi:hypothetical protein SAMN05421762_1147 [Pseudooceanicola nitratireducens]|uniref:Uncharacterized protein n=1 Tax=Pseudooceanicola nitratireducens TaxID=517719 RepID=A0A1I1JQ58_9RHOB|nr:hypothetical protein SAMN05216183_103646 [Pseudooceanicola nitratireducens]SFC50704.1 hypothetical protein SAMN05421762_1147 [Pseudooceanicola nitratireducens]